MVEVQVLKVHASRLADVMTGPLFRRRSNALRVGVDGGNQDTVLCIAVQDGAGQ